MGIQTVVHFDKHDYLIEDCTMAFWVTFEYITDQAKIQDDPMIS